MNGILAKSSDNKLHGLLAPKSSGSVETAGSLAMNPFFSLFETNNYDMFSSSNPFSVDYSLYADYGENVAYSGFLEGFSNAFSTLNSDGGFSCGSFSDSGFSGCSAGGFTSVC